MKREYSIMQSQHNLAQVIRDVEAGYEVSITRRRKPVARVMAPEDDGRVALPDFAARARAIWGDTRRGAGSDELLHDSRGER